MLLLSNKIVIAGGGIIGNSIAYYLSKLYNQPCTIIDPVGIAPGASSKAGGFLAKDWRDSTPLEEMQRIGFDLHQELSNDLSQTTDYRRLTCQAVAVDETKQVQKPTSRKLNKDVEWVDRNVIGSVEMGNISTIAQVHPRKLCEKMFEFCQRQTKSKLLVGRIIKAITTKTIDENENNNNNNSNNKQQIIIKGIQLEDGTEIDTDILIIACGPWTNEAFKTWFTTTTSTTDDEEEDEEENDNDTATTILPEITSIKCHSILVKAPQTLNQAVFFESDGKIGDGDLEVYPRPDGDCYINGFQGLEGVIEERPGNEEIEDDAIKKLKDAMKQTTSILDGLEPHTVQACYWPETPDGLPVIGELPHYKNVFVATGHSVWGICQGPATGKALAQLIMEGKSKCCLDLSKFRIDRDFDIGFK